MWRGRAFPQGPGLSVHTPNTHTNTPHTQAKKRSSVNTDPCERLGFMELMGGCMGTFPGGSFCLFFWWRRRSRRPSSSHHEDRRAGKGGAEEERYRRCRIPVRNNCRGNSPLLQALQKKKKKTPVKTDYVGRGGQTNNNLGTEASEQIGT